MQTTFEGKRLAGVVTVLPQNEYFFDDEIAEAEAPRAKRLKNIMGYGRRRRTKATTTGSDLMLYGIRHILDKNYIKKEDIGAIVTVTLSPDYFVPTMSSILHGELDLDSSVFCVDIQQGCTGYIVGLMQSFMLLEHMKEKKVLLCTAEIFNRKTEENEPKYSYAPFGGDCANITVVENSDDNKKIYYEFCQDGKNRNCLIIPDGAFKSPMTPEKIATQVSRIPFTGVQMDGSAVFNFVQEKVPILLESISKMAGINIEDIDWFLFHQPNKFMLQKLAERVGIPFSKMPMDIVEKFGNADACTIPTVITEDVSEEMISQDNMCCLSGFGAGLSWAAIIMEIGKLEFCENIISNL